MLNRWAVLWLCLGGVAGAAMPGRSVTAQANPYPFTEGDRITLQYEDGRSWSCAVGAIHGLYIRCDRPDSRVTATRIGERTRQTWLSLASVREIAMQVD